MLRLSTWAAIGLLTAVLIGPAAFGGIVITDQSRSLHINGSTGVIAPAPETGPSFDQTITADPNVPFNRSLQNSVSFPDPDPRITHGSSVFVDQNSTIALSPGGIQLDATGHVHGSAGPGTMDRADGVSNYSVTFVLDAPASYRLDATIDYDAISFPSASVLLMQGSTRIAGLQDHRDTFYSQTFTGTLAPGTYTLTAQTFGHGAPDAFIASYDAKFTATAVPTPTAFWPGLIMLALLAGSLSRTRVLRHT